MTNFKCSSIDIPEVYEAQVSGFIELFHCICALKTLSVTLVS